MPFLQVSKSPGDSELDWSLFSLCGSETPGKLCHQEKVSVAVNPNHVKLQWKEKDETPNPKHLNLSLKTVPSHHRISGRNICNDSRVERRL